MGGGRGGSDGEDRWEEGVMGRGSVRDMYEKKS